MVREYTPNNWWNNQHFVEWRGICRNEARTKIVMWQRAVDSVVLGLFSMLYSCAVALLKLRDRRPEPQVRAGGKAAAL